MNEGRFSYEYWIIQTLLLIVNTALVMLIAFALGIDVMSYMSKREAPVWIGLGFLLVVAENVIRDKIHGNS